MSIVDDALQALGKSGDAADAGRPEQAARVLAARSVAHELYARRAAPARRKPWPLVVAVVLLLLGVATWWLMDRAVTLVPAPPIAIPVGVPTPAPKPSLVSGEGVLVETPPASQAPGAADLPLKSSGALATLPATETPVPPQAIVVPEMPPVPAVAATLPVPVRATEKVGRAVAQTPLAAAPARSEQAASNAAAPGSQAAGEPAATVPTRQASAALPVDRINMALSVDDRASRALDALGRGDLKEAMQLADALIAAQPQRWEGHYVRGTALLAGGRVPEAEAALEQALVLQPDSASVLLQSGIAAQEAGQVSKALGLLRRARTIAPDNAAVWLNLGYAAELAGSNEEAETAYQRYLRLTSARSGTESQRTYVTERLRQLAKP